MEAILILIFIALVIAGIVVFVRGREREKVGAAAGPAGLPSAPPQSPLGGGEVRGLKVGDVVNHEMRDYIVEGTVRFEQGGYRWEEHRLVDGEDVLWLSVEDDEGLELVLWRRFKGLGLEPGAATISHEGIEYALDERGKANFTSEGVTGMAPGGKIEYADYEAGDKRLGFERGEGEESWEVSVGEAIDEAMLDVYPSRGSTG